MYIYVVGCGQHPNTISAVSTGVTDTPRHVSQKILGVITADRLNYGFSISLPCTLSTLDLVRDLRLRVSTVVAAPALPRASEWGSAAACRETAYCSLSEACNIIYDHTDSLPKQLDFLAMASATLLQGTHICTQTQAQKHTRKRVHTTPHTHALRKKSPSDGARPTVQGVQGKRGIWGATTVRSLGKEGRRGCGEVGLQLRRVQL